MFQSDFCGENQNTHFRFNYLFPPENHVVYVTLLKHMIQPDQTGHRWKYTAYELYMLGSYGNKHTLRICNIAFQLQQ